MIAGCLILLTIFVPWFAGTGPSLWSGFGEDRARVVMSWDLVRHGSGLWTAFLITSWYIGLAAAVCALCLRGLASAVAISGHGLLGVLFLLVLWAMLPRGPSIPAVTSSIGPLTLHLIWLIGLLLLLTFLAIRRRIGRVMPIRIGQGGVAAVVCILTLVGFLVSVSNFSELPDKIKEEFVLELVMALVVHLVALAGSVVALVDAARPTSSSRKLAEVSIGLLTALLAAVVLYAVIRPATLKGIPGGAALAVFNFMVLICVPLLFLLLGGSVRIVLEGHRRYTLRGGEVKQGARRREARDTDRSGAAMDQLIRERLARLQRLFDDGLITKKEYVDRRAAILQDI